MKGALALALLLGVAQADTLRPGVNVQQGGVAKGHAQTLNFTGASVTQSGSTATVSVSGGPGGSSSSGVSGTIQTSDGAGGFSSFAGASCSGSTWMRSLTTGGTSSCLQPAWGDLSGVPLTFAPSAHTHPASDLTATGIGPAVFLRGDNTWTSPPAQDWSVITGKPSTFPAATPVATASALAATPTTCTGQAATGVLANGNATGCYTPTGTYTLPDATASVTGGVRLTGQLGGTATSPTVTGVTGAVVGVSNLNAAGTPSSTTFLRGDGTWNTATGGSGAPTTSKYLLQVADAALSNAQAMGALVTGLVKNTTTTGLQSIAAAGTDYVGPTSGSSILIGSAGQTTSDVNLAWNGSALNIGQGTILAANPLAIAGTVNGYVQANIQNKSNGASASSDWIATADTGTDTTNYLDCGINSSAYSDTGYTITGALTGYCYSNGGDFALGTQTSGKALKLHTGGTLAANLRATLSDTALTLASGVSLAGPAGYLGALNSGALSDVDTAAVTAGDILIRNVGNTQWSHFAIGGANTVLHGGTTAPAFSALDLANDTAATVLPMAKGGNGSAITGTVGALRYSASSTTTTELADVAVGSALVSGGLTTVPAWSATGTCTSSSATTCTIASRRSGCLPVCSMTTAVSTTFRAAISTTTITCTFGTSGTNTCNCVCF